MSFYTGSSAGANGLAVWLDGQGLGRNIIRILMTRKSKEEYKPLQMSKKHEDICVASECSPKPDISRGGSE